MKYKKLKLISLIFICFASFVYAGLEETSEWYEYGLVHGSWTQHDGYLKVEDTKQVGFYVLTTLPTRDNYTLKLKARIYKVYDPNKYWLVLYFGGGVYKLILNGKGTITSLYKARDRCYRDPWILKWIYSFWPGDPPLELEPLKWYDIEIRKYEMDIEIRVGGRRIILGADSPFSGGWDIALGAYNSEVWYDDVEIASEVSIRAPSREGLSHEFFTQKAVDIYSPKETHWDYYKKEVIYGGWKEDSEDWVLLRGIFTTLIQVRDLLFWAKDGILP